MTTVDDFLSAGSSAPSASFPTIGTTYKGTVVRSEVTQQRDIQTGDPKFWNDGQPMNQLVVTIQTDLRDSSIEDDNGQRRIFLKGSKKPESKSSLAAVIVALGKNRLEVGGTLTIRYTGDGEATSRGFTAPKQYAAKYEPPVAQPDAFDPFADEAEAPF